MSLFITLAILGVLYNRASDPNMWRWLVPNNEARADAVAPVEKITKPELLQETIVEGPNDLDDAQMIDFRAMCRVLEDKKPLKNYEMPAYWKLMGWTRTQSMADLERRARRDVVFTQLWQAPETYRGKLVRMRVHVRRALVHEAPENSLGIKQVYELLGFTDESLSFPYFMVLSEKPEGLDLGAAVEGDAVFVGYFLKVMGYEAFDNKRASPLLIGKLRLLDGSTKRKAAAVASGWEYGLLAGGGLVVVGGFVLQALMAARRGKSNRLKVSGEVIPEELPTDFFAASNAKNDASQIAPDVSQAVAGSSDENVAVAVAEPVAHELVAATNERVLQPAPMVAAASVEESSSPTAK